MEILEDVINISPDDIEIIDTTGYCADLTEHFDGVSEILNPFVKGAKRSFKKIEHLIYSAPAFINAVKAVIPEETYQVILSDEQKTKIAKGALKLMTKKDGSLMANLINPETKKIVSTISLEKVKLSPEMSMLHKCKWHKSLNKFK